MKMLLEPVFLDDSVLYLAGTVHYIKLLLPVAWRADSPMLPVDASVWDTEAFVQAGVANAITHGAALKPDGVLSRTQTALTFQIAKE